VEVRVAKTIGESAEAFPDLLPVPGRKFLHTLLEARVEVDLHNLPVKGLVRLEARAF
jgi:hypothetical protein